MRWIRGGKLYVYRSLDTDGHEGWCLVGLMVRLWDGRYVVTMGGKHRATVASRDEATKMLEGGLG